MSLTRGKAVGRRTLVVAGLAVAVALVLAACSAFDEETVVGSGNIVTRQQSVADFTVVEAGSTFEITISRASSFEVSITADDNLFDHISVSREGKRLVIDVEEGFVVRNATLRAGIAMPALEGVRLSGASRATVTDFRSSDDLDIDLSGASRLEGDVGAGDCEFRLSGASRLTLRGSAREVRVEASGASSVDLEDFPVERARVTLSGASSATVDVRKVLGPVRLLDASRLTYLGEPSIENLSSSGASRIEPR